MKTLYNGKTKTVLLDEATGIVNLFFKDSAAARTAFLTPAPTVLAAALRVRARSV
mgnify:CR=1 FL=1